MKKTLYFYRLTDALGTQRITVVDDPTNNGTILGIGIDGELHQYDSYELWYAYDWAEKHGMKLESGELEMDIPDKIFTLNS